MEVHASGRAEMHSSIQIRTGVVVTRQVDGVESTVKLVKQKKDVLIASAASLLLCSR
jgi:hypothetical protein